MIFLLKNPSQRLLSTAMGFSAGVMIAVSVFELIPLAIETLSLINVSVLFIAGMVMMMFIDFIIPHEYKEEGRACRDGDGIWEEYERRRHKDRLIHTGKLVALGIAIHNVPEGFVTITGTIESTNLGLILALAIAMHNIPEGLSVAFPLYVSSGKKKNAFNLSFLSGIAEPIGGIIGLLALTLLFDITLIVDYALAFVAGIMIFISIDELLPCAYDNCNDKDAHLITLGIITGMIVMLVTLVILG